jgi:hypothetical protein
VLLPWWKFFGRRVAVQHLHDLHAAMPLLGLLTPRPLRDVEHLPARREIPGRRRIGQVLVLVGSAVLVVGLQARLLRAVVDTSDFGGYLEAGWDRVHPDPPGPP